MTEPTARRPAMPGYGVQGPDEGTGLLPWSWAEERLTSSRDYWLATTFPDGRPHLMPVWGMWHDGSLWFSSSRGSRKARNLRRDPRCSVSTDDPLAPVVVEGAVELVTSLEALQVVVDLENEKYGTDYGLDVFDPSVNANFRLVPRRVFGLIEADFTGSPTCWTFEPGSEKRRPAR